MSKEKGSLKIHQSLKFRISTQNYIKDIETKFSKIRTRLYQGYMFSYIPLETKELKGLELVIDNTAAQKKLGKQTPGRVFNLANKILKESKFSPSKEEENELKKGFMIIMNMPIEEITKRRIEHGHAQYVEQFFYSSFCKEMRICTR